jgi:hypothetical protein
MQLAILSSAIDRSSSSDEWSSNASGLIAGNPVMGTLDSARAKQSELERTLNFTFDTREAAAYVYNFLPASSSESYNRCIDRVFGQGNLQITSRILDEDNSMVRINWPGRPGETGTYVLRVRSNGTTEARNTVIAASGGPIEIVVTRLNPAKPLIVIAELVRSQDRNSFVVSSASVAFPPVVEYMQSDPIVTEVRSNASVALCGIRYGGPQKQGPTVQLVATQPGAVLSNVRFEELPLPPQHLRATSVAGHKAGLFMDPPTPTLVTGRAECGVADGREMHAMSGVLVGTQTVITVTRKEPKDNTVRTPVRLILPAQPTS